MSNNLALSQVARSDTSNPIPRMVASYFHHFTKPSGVNSNWGFVFFRF